MSVPTGKFLTALILATTPTALGKSLDAMPKSIEHWNRELENGNHDKPDAIAILRQVLNDPVHKRLLEALLVPVQMGGQTMPLAKAVVAQTWAVGTTPGVLNHPWSFPPHPSGAADLQKLIDTLAGYDETQ